MNRENERLKNKILDLAIRGKLVPQDINDEPASVLLERIKQERKKLIAEKKIKQENYSEIYKDPTDNHYYEKFEDGTINDITEEIPFEIPNNWAWSRLKNVASVKGGKRIPKDEKLLNTPTKHIYLRVTDMKNNTIDSSKLQYISDNVYEKIKNYTISSDDLYLTIAGTIGNIGIIPPKFNDMNLTENAVKLCNLSINKEILLYFIQSQFIQNQFTDKISKVAQPKLSIQKIEMTLIPIPSLKEHLRIIKTIENSTNLIIKKDKNDKKIIKLKNILKSKILDKAIQGKIIKQNEDDESAEILINKILDEKRALIKSKEIKKENLSIIYKNSDNQFYEKFDDGKIINITEEIPFDIPKNWRWSRLSTICTKIVDGDHNPPQSQNIQTEYIMLSAKNIQNNQLVNFSDARFLSKEDYDKGKQRISLKNGDILLTIVGTLGRSCIYKDIGKNILFQRSVSVISTLINNNYLKFVFDSSYIQNKMQKESTGTAQRGFYLNQLSNVLIPVPPINEEFFIINKLNELLKTAE